MITVKIFASLVSLIFAFAVGVADKNDPDELLIVRILTVLALVGQTLVLFA